jgi:N-acyl-L-homoserine lactone synthetase
VGTVEQRRVSSILRRMGWALRRTGKARYYVHEEDKAAAK